MDKKLPSMYQSDIKKEIKNSMNSYYSRNNVKKKSDNGKIISDTKSKTQEKSYIISARKKVYNIFKISKYDFVINTRIEYNDGKIEDRKIIGQDNKNIITFDREKIRIDDIKDIYII